MVKNVIISSAARARNFYIVTLALRFSLHSSDMNTYLDSLRVWVINIFLVFSMRLEILCAFSCDSFFHLIN